MSKAEKGGIKMIEVTKLDNSKLWVNAELIHSMQSAPETVITFTTKDRIMVKEPVEEVSKRIIEYHRMVNTGAGIGDIIKTNLN
jgi:flagellar protein FlbD